MKSIKYFLSGQRLVAVALAATAVTTLVGCSSGDSVSGVLPRPVYSVDANRGPTCGNANRALTINSNEIRCVWDSVIFQGEAQALTVTFTRTDGIWIIASEEATEFADSSATTTDGSTDADADADADADPDATTDGDDATANT